MEISLEELAIFLKEANKNTYANKNASKVISTRLKSEDYHFEKDNLIYHDTYFGNRDFIGEEIIYKENEPAWVMNYYGYILNLSESESEVYNFLRKALMYEYLDVIPVRGPKSYNDGEWRYVNTPIGELDRFIGEEQIYRDNELIYQANYHGGLIG